MAVLIKVTLDHERDTKRYHVYLDPTGGYMGKVYVPRQGDVPAAPQVTLTVES